MKNYLWLLSFVCLLGTEAFADNDSIATRSKAEKPRSQKCNQMDEQEDPQGWSIDLGGQYTWMSFTTPPTFKGSTGGAVGKLTYQTPDAFFGQLRSIYNIGSLSSGSQKSRDSEWYTEFVGGYCFTVMPHGTITPYVGMGLDFLHDNKKSHGTIAAIKLDYSIYYALAGLDFQYYWRSFSVGAKVECLPTFNQYLSIKGLKGASWKMKNRVGWDVQVPVGFKIAKDIWLEMTPYYRQLPIGASHVLKLPHRNLNEVGVFVAFRFFI